MEIPRLAVNPSGKHSDEFYQISNISEDKKFYDFMGFERLSVDNTWAASIIRDRLDENYYQDLDYDLTGDDLDEQDIACIAEGIAETKYDLASVSNSIIPTRPPLKGIDWDELDRLSKGEDMTKEDIDKYVLETYKLDYESIKRDNEIVKRHEKIAEMLESMNTVSNDSLELTKQDIQEIESRKNISEGQITAQEQIEEYKNKKEKKGIEVVDLLEETDPKAIRNSLVSEYGATDSIDNYMYFSLFFKELIGEDQFEENKANIRLIVGNTSKQLSFGFLDKKVYKGLLKFVALEMSSRGMIAQIFGEDVDSILQSH